MRVLENSASRDATDPLADATAAEAFWQTLPRADPIAAQKAVCAALADFIARGRPSIPRLRALLALDQRARSLIDALLVNYVAGDRKPPALEAPFWQAAFVLSWSFSQAHRRFLWSMRDSLLFQGWRGYLPQTALRLFHHRATELLLRPFVDELSTRPYWKELHEAYRFADSQGVLHHPLVTTRVHSQQKMETTLEREYIHILFQDLVNGGQFPPHDAFWLNQGIARWCESAALRPHEAGCAGQHLVVDLDGDAGLARCSREAAGTCLELDPAPILESIRVQIAATHDGRGDPGKGLPSRRERQRKLLTRLTLLCAPERPVIARRGERKPVALTVEVVVGISQILRRLRDNPQDAAIAGLQRATPAEGITITALGRVTEIPTGARADDGSTVTQWSAGGGDSPRPPMTMVDCSDSGCRLHGPTADASPIMPGALIAFRDGAASPWTLAVVRRVKKRLAGKRIEIGVEFVGNDPRRIIVLAADSAGSTAGPVGSERPRYSAIYLPQSAKHPVLPIKTLVLPARRFTPEGLLKLRSRSAVYAVRLKEPLEEQADFLWSPFEIVERRSAEIVDTGVDAALT